MSGVQGKIRLNLFPDQWFDFVTSAFKILSLQSNIIVLAKLGTYSDDQIFVGASIIDKLQITCFVRAIFVQQFLFPFADV